MNLCYNRVTVADLAALNDLPENRDKRFELIGGIVFEVPTGTLKRAYITGQVFGFSLAIETIFPAE